MKNKELCRDVFQRVRDVLKIPFTIKMRAGWDKYHDEALEIAKIGEECGVDAVALHARTRAQGYSGEANWDLIKEFKNELKVPVIGNGDITHFSQVDPLIEETGCDAVMIGRGAVATPWFFKSYHEGRDWNPNAEEMKELIMTQYEAFFGYFGQDHGIKHMRKHLCAYTKGVRDVSSFRNRIIRMTDWDDIRHEVKTFFTPEKYAYSA